MNNMFDQEVFTRKRLARGSYSRKNGSKSKKCTLESDKLTPAQWKKRNGDVMTYDLKSPMDWACFKKMPLDLQKEYIAYLSDRFRVSQKDLADMFGVCIPTLTRHMKEYWFPKLDGKRRPTAIKIKWESFLRGELAEETVVSVDEVCDMKEGHEEDGVETASNGPEVEREASDVRLDCCSTLSEFSMTFFGELDAVSIMRELDRVLNGRGICQMTVTCQVEAGAA